METQEIFREVIPSYTAEEAVEDGVLVNVPEALAKEAGFEWPVRITTGVHDLCTPPASNKVESYEGRLWDVLFLCFIAIKSHKNDDGLVTYRVKLGSSVETLWAAIDGTAGPAIHIMKPDEY